MEVRKKEEEEEKGVEGKGGLEGNGEGGGG